MALRSSGSRNCECVGYMLMIRNPFQAKTLIALCLGIRDVDLARPTTTANLPSIRSILLECFPVSAGFVLDLHLEAI